MPTPDAVRARSVLSRVRDRGWLRPLLGIARILPGYYRVAFRGAGFRSGILQRLGRGPASPEVLATDLGLRLAMADALASWLDLGVELGELRRRGRAYEIRSRQLRVLLRANNDPVRAFYEEFAVLDHRLVVETPERLGTGELFGITDVDADLIARVSRAGEPWLEVAIEREIPRGSRHPFRLVEVGPGSGVHMRAAALLDPHLIGVGVELQETAAAGARHNIAAWGLADRLEIRTGDVREVTGSGDADLVTLHQNVYYFPESEQSALLRHLGTFLRPGGRILVTTIVRGGGIGTAGLDLWGAMTAGASRLPRTGDLVGRLREAGYEDVAATPIGPGGLYVAFSGTWPS